MILIRPAAIEDADAISAVLIGSITVLCIADHHNDPNVLIPWLRNKTPVEVQRMLLRADAPFIVAVRHGQIVGVGAASTSGEVLLNYVSPASRFAGVSKALLLHLEAQIRLAGAETARLHSTLTALPFYRAQGWVESGVGGAMEKRL